MKKKFILLCLFNCCFYLSNTALAVTYTSKVIIDAKYGDKDGEFGAFVDEGKGEGHYSIAPEAFCVDIKGNIYISDGYLHRKIQKFDLDGRFLFSVGKDLNLSESCLYIFGTDKNADLYVMDKKNTCIHKFNKEGKYIKKIGGKGKILKKLGNVSDGSIEKIIEDGMFSEYVDLMYVSYSGNLYVQDPCHEKPYQKFNLEGKFIEKCDHFIEDIEGNEYIGEKDNRFKLKKFRKEGNNRIRDNTFNMNISEIGNLQGYSFLGFDKKNNIYFWQASVFTGKYYTSGSTVYIFNKNGKYIDTVEIYPIKVLQGMGGNQVVIIDFDGNIYQLQQLKTGIQIIKWERKEGKSK